MYYITLLNSLPKIVGHLFVIVLALYGYSFSQDVHPQNTKQCVTDRDLNEELMKVKCELVRNKEEFRVFKGKVYYANISEYLQLLKSCSTYPKTKIYPFTLQC